MGHYSDYYEAEVESRRLKERERKVDHIKKFLDDADGDLGARLSDVRLLYYVVTNINKMHGFFSVLKSSSNEEFDSY